jgi:hypothetical protein
MEIRIMYIWLDRMRAVNTIIRMGRGAQMGVDHNKGFAWVGASAGFIDRYLVEMYVRAALGLAG